jgi:hypothetical protein
LASREHARSLAVAVGLALALGPSDGVQARPTSKASAAQLALAAPDSATMPDLEAPPVPVERTGRGGKPGSRADASRGATGWAHTLLQPAFRDPRRRLPRTVRPAGFGETLRVGEHFRFDVTFAGNPAGLAEARIVALEPDPRGGPPRGAPLVRIEGHARTSGIVSLLATVTDDMVTTLDAATGATISSENVLKYSGWSPVGYKTRITTSAYEGRGSVRIVDVKDGKPRKHLKRGPIDTFDPLSVMAWVRAQRLEPGERVKAHVVDGVTLMRLEIEGKGTGGLARMPSIGKALGLGADDVVKITGTMTRVDVYDQPLPGKRVFKLDAWLSADDRRIPLVMESDMWVGALRLELSSYDPPPAQGRGAAAAASP